MKIPDIRANSPSPLAALDPVNRGDGRRSPPLDRSVARGLRCAFLIPLRALLGLLLLGVLVALPARPASLQPGGGLEEHLLVDGRRMPGVRHEGKPWTRGKRFIEGRGAGNRLLARPLLGEGDFTVRAKLQFLGVRNSAAAFRLGANYFGFASRKRESALFVMGADLNPGASRGRLLPGTNNYIGDGAVIEFEARRSAGRLTFRINGHPVHSVETGNKAFGIFGFVPFKATLRVFRFTVTARPVEVRRFVDDALQALQPAIDKAIDRGARFLVNQQLRSGAWRSMESKYVSGQTALAVYTLLKAGYPPAHPAVRRGLISMAQIDPLQTYTIACHLLALEATKDPSHHPRMRKLLAALLDEQSGGFGYPNSYERGAWTHVRMRNDLSNAQYAALGMRIARLAGLKVAPRAWSELLSEVLKYRAQEERVTVPGRPGMSKTYKMPARGFTYVPGAKATGSMTAAGVSILAICRNALGARMTASHLRGSDLALKQGLNWLAHHFSVTRNPGRKRAWLYYYLYGLERVGSILDTRTLGKHRWYYEGAKQLVADQKKRGNWAERYTEPDTCFAVLFLKRATAADTGQDHRMRFAYQPQGTGHEVRLHGFGHWPMRLWISGFGGDRKPRVVRVEYLVDGKVIRTLPGDPSRAWSGESFTVKHRFTSTGRHRVTARVYVVRPGAPAASVKANGFTARIADVFCPWMQYAAEARKRNRLGSVGVTVKTSSSYRKKTGNLAVDGFESSAWVCRAGDESPWITLTLDRAVLADRVVLGQAAAARVDRNRWDPIRTVKVWINQERTPLDARLAEDVLEPTSIAFSKPKMIRRLKVVITAREPKGRRPGLCGFSEIILENRRK